MILVERVHKLLEGVDVTDDIQGALDDLVTEVAHKSASDAANENVDDSCDDRLHDEAGLKASSINNQGPEGQVKWLLEQGLSEDEISSLAFDDPMDDDTPHM